MRKRSKCCIGLVIACICFLMTQVAVYADEDQVLTENQQELKLIEECIIEEANAVTFDGTQKRPDINVYDGDYLLIKGKDFIISYGENIHAGKGELTIIGQGSYRGEVTTTFVIERADVLIKGSHVASTGKPKISWSKVKGAEKYKVYFRTKKNGPFKYLITTETSSYTHKSAKKGIRYDYQVKAVDYDGRMTNFNKSNIVESVCKLTAPKIKTSNIAKSGKPKLSWDKVSGAEKYAIYRALSKNGTYKYVTTTKKTIWIHKNAIAGKCYYYKVKAIDTDNREADSLTSSVMKRTCDLKKPAIKSITLNSNAKPKLMWQKINRADKYKIYRSKKKNGTYKYIGTSTGKSFVDKTAKGGNVYYYRIMAVDKDNKNANSVKSLKTSVYVVNLNKKLVALTFDDGPGPYTESIVNALKKHNSRATFYVLGQRVNSYKSALKAVHAGGNEIGNHSYSHLILSYENSDTIKSQMDRTDRAIKKIVGITPATMRPPGGGVDSTVKKTVGKPIIYWSIDTRDWETRSKSETVRRVMNEVSDGDIVLMHDIHEPTMEAALELIPKLKKAGYELVTVSEMAKFKGKKMKDGVVYYSF